MNRLLIASLALIAWAYPVHLIAQQRVELWGHANCEACVTIKNELQRRG